MLTRRNLAIAAAILALPVALALAQPTWAQAMGLDIWNMPALQQETRSYQAQSQELEAQGREVRSRITAKDLLIADLVAGRSTLAATTARFLELNELRPEYMEVIRITYPGATDEEKMVRNVITFTTAQLSRQPAWQRFGTLARLNMELAAFSAEQNRPVSQ